MNKKLNDPILQDILKSYFKKAGATSTTPATQPATTQAPVGQTPLPGQVDYSSILDQYLGNKPIASAFDSFIDKTLKHEGGFTVDQGGATMRGVTWRDNKNELSQLGYTKDTLKDLTPDDAKKLYKIKYFETPGLHALPEDLQYLAFDYSVNSGPQRAIKGLQKIIGVKADGKLGPETLSKLSAYTNEYGSTHLKKAYVEERKKFLKDLARKDPKKHGGSLKGWMNRLNNIEQSIFS